MGIRLPRGTTTPFSFGATITPEQVNYEGDVPYGRSEKVLPQGQTVPVATLPANPWGLYEMHGNVWEWCADGMRSYTAEAATDPVGPTDTGASRVVRGGSWYSHARDVRSASRARTDPGTATTARLPLCPSSGVVSRQADRRSQ